MSDAWNEARGRMSRRHGDPRRPSRPSGSPIPHFDQQSPSPLLAPVPFANGRVLAWAALQEMERTDRFLQDTLADLAHCHQLPSAERALAVDIASGVIRRRRTLDCLIAKVLTRPRQQTEPELWQILRMGVFQLLFARTPPHAAVSSSVELCRSLHRDRWTGFVNGILRSLGRLQIDQPAQGPSASSLPADDGRWIQFSADIVPDPQLAPAEWFADAFSLPSELARRWVQQLNEADRIAAGFFFNEPPRTTLRINRLRATRNDLQQALTAAGILSQPGLLEDSLHVPHAGAPERLPGFTEGLWSVQDESAQNAALMLNPRPGESILDLCAAPGGKTTHLAELSRDLARIVACDVSRHRLDRIQQNQQRLGLTSIELHLIGRSGEGLPTGDFNAALVDVPCSNTGVLHRRPEARWRFDAAALAELNHLQTRLLLTAASRIRRGGRLVYSTCSLEPEENTGVVHTALHSLPDFQLIQETLHKPGAPADGAYQALLERKP
ncbi:MAG: transcription antitermination factor NusB [Planctomycetaceae bacterium]